MQESASTPNVGRWIELDKKKKRIIKKKQIDTYLLRPTLQFRKLGVKKATQTFKEFPPIVPLWPVSKFQS